MGPLLLDIGVGLKIISLDNLSAISTTHFLWHVSYGKEDEAVLSEAFDLQRWLAEALLPEAHFLIMSIMRDLQQWKGTQQQSKYQYLQEREYVYLIKVKGKKTITLFAHQFRGFRKGILFVLGWTFGNRHLTILTLPKRRCLTHANFEIQ